MPCIYYYKQISYSSRGMRDHVLLTIIIISYMFVFWLTYTYIKMIHNILYQVNFYRSLTSQIVIIISTRDEWCTDVYTEPYVRRAARPSTCTRRLTTDYTGRSDATRRPQALFEVGDAITLSCQTVINEIKTIRLPNLAISTHRIDELHIQLMRIVLYSRQR